MMWRSYPAPAIGWGKPIMAVCIGIGLPALVGIAVLLWSDTPVTGPPKDGSARSFISHLTFIAAALTAAPIIAWVAVPIAVPLLRFAVQLGWAGWGSACAVALLIGLPLIHILLNGDLTTEDPSILPHMMLALIVQGLCVWGAAQSLQLGTKSVNAPSDPP